MHCLRHRGPDEHGTWNDADLVFGFNRLSIIDIAHSHQPLRWGPAGAARPVCPDLQRRDLQLPRTARGTRRRVRARRSRPKATARPSSRRSTTGAPRQCAACAECSRSRSGTPENRELFLARDPFGIKPLFLATGTARHRVRQREEEPSRTGRPDRHRYRTRSAGRSSTTRSCSTCPSPKRCTRRSAGSSRAATRA